MQYTCPPICAIVGGMRHSRSAPDSSPALADTHQVFGGWVATLIVAGFVAAFITAIGVFSPNKVRLSVLQHNTMGVAHYAHGLFWWPLVHCWMLLMMPHSTLVSQAAG